MNTLDKKYTDLLQDILDNGTKKMDRTGTGTISVFGRQIRHKMSEGFPLLTTKKMYFKGIVTELLWFLRGDTNIKYLLDNDCNIWTGDAYKYYLKTYSFSSNSVSYKDYRPENGSWDIDNFVRLIKEDDWFANMYGNLGPVYGKQWRNWKGFEHGWHDVAKVIDGIEPHVDYIKGIDQIANLINDLKTNPDSRRLMVTAWNPTELDKMVLPPCHYGFQVYTRELSLGERGELFKKIYPEKSVNDFAPNGMEVQSLRHQLDTRYNNANIPTRAISLMWNQRSVDIFLGLPFNIASYGLLLEIIAKEVNMIPDELIGNLGDTHLYLNHIEQAKEQIGSELSTEDRWDLYHESSNEPLDPQKGFDNKELNRICDDCFIPKRTREPFQLPKLVHMKTEAFYKSLSEEPSLYGHFDTKDFQLENYQSHPSIKAPLSN